MVLFRQFNASAPVVVAIPSARADSAAVMNPMRAVDKRRFISKRNLAPAMLGYFPERVGTLIALTTA